MTTDKPRVVERHEVRAICAASTSPWRRGVPEKSGVYWWRYHNRVMEPRLCEIWLFAEGGPLETVRFMGLAECVSDKWCERVEFAPLQERAPE